jgi:hypothetical protein
MTTYHRFGLLSLLFLLLGPAITEAQWIAEPEQARPRFEVTSPGAFETATPSYRVVVDQAGVLYAAPRASVSRDFHAGLGPENIRVWFSRVRMGGIDLWVPAELFDPVLRAQSVIELRHGPELATVVEAYPGCVKINVGVGPSLSFPASAPVEFRFRLEGAFRELSWVRADGSTERFSADGDVSLSIGQSVVFDAASSRWVADQAFDVTSGELVVTIAPHDWNCMRFPILVDPPINSVFLVGGGGGSDINPDVASDGSAYLVVWENGSNNVLGQFMTVPGTPAGSVFTIWTGDAIGRVRACWSPYGGHYVVVWDGRTTSGGTYDIYKAIVAPGTTSASQIATVNAQNGRNAREPDVGAAGSQVNGALIVYSEQVSGSDFDVWLADCDAAGNVQSRLLLEGSPEMERNPAVPQQALPSMVQEDDFAVVWEKGPADGDPAHDIRYCYVDISAPASNAPITISLSGLDEFEPDIAGSDPNYVVIWKKDNFGTFDIESRRMSGMTPVGTSVTTLFSSGSGTGGTSWSYLDAKVSMNPVLTLPPAPAIPKFLAAATRLDLPGNNREIRTRELTLTGTGTGLSPGTTYPIGSAPTYYGAAAVCADSNAACQGYLIAFDQANTATGSPTNIRAQMFTDGCIPQPGGGGGGPCLTVTGISPASGSSCGGNTVTITGSGFLSAAWIAVWFNGVLASNITILSDTQLTCIVPPHPGGPLVANVVVGSACGLQASTAYTYVNPTSMSVTGISAISGPVAGGNSVTIYGTGFCGGWTAVWFNGYLAANIVVVSDTQISCTVPAFPTGPYAAQVFVAKPWGNGSTTYTYVAPPNVTVTGVNPSSGPSAGGNTVTIYGTNFLGGWTAVWFNGVRALDASVTVVSNTELTCVVPPRNPNHPMNASVVVGKPWGGGWGSYQYQ